MNAYAPSLKTRALAFTAALALILGCALAFAQTARAATYYDLWVSGTRITSDNAADVFGDGTVSYDNASKTLTLSNAKIMIHKDPFGGEDAAGILSTMDDLTINLENASSIEAGSPLSGSYFQGIAAYGDYLTFTGPGRLTIEMVPLPIEDWEVVTGIYASGYVLVDDTTLYLDVSSMGGVMPGNYGIYCAGGLTTQGDAWIDMNVGTAENINEGICSRNTVRFADNSHVSIRGNHNTTSTSGTSRATGINAPNVYVVGNASATVSAGQCKSSDGQSAAILSTGGVITSGRARLYATDYYGYGIDAKSIMARDDSILAAAGYPRALSVDPSLSSHNTGGALVSAVSASLDDAYKWDGSNPLGGSASPYTFVHIPDTTYITRLAGNYANETSASIAIMTFGKYGSPYAVLARDDDFADALGATGLAGVLDCPIILTDREELSEAAAEAMGMLEVEEVYIIGGEGAMKPQLEEDLVDSLGIDSAKIHRVWGENSYDTSLECAKMITELGGHTDTAIIAMSTNFQDALSISPIAYTQELPVVLQTWGDTSAERGFTDDAKAWLANRQLLVVGGPGAISNESIAGFDLFDRIYGETGYDTSDMIAKWAIGAHLLSSNNVVIACGAQAPKGVDALAGAALAGRFGCPILLVNGNDAMEAVDTTTIDGYLTDHKGDVINAYVLGGEYVVPPALYDQIKTLIGAVEGMVG